MGGGQATTVASRAGVHHNAVTTAGAVFSCPESSLYIYRNQNDLYTVAGLNWHRVHPDKP